MARIITPYRCVAIACAELAEKIQLRGGLLRELSLMSSKEAG